MAVWTDLTKNKPGKNPYTLEGRSMRPPRSITAGDDMITTTPKRRPLCDDTPALSPAIKDFLRGLAEIAARDFLRKHAGTPLPQDEPDAFDILAGEERTSC
jgi:hypothetical protein